MLRRNRIKVSTGVRAEAAAKLNEAYLKFITKGIPFVTLKAAMSLDGKIATKTGESKWITGETTTRYTHRIRSWYDGIMVGTDTVIRDNPGLISTGTRTPMRIILDRQLRIPLSARVFDRKAPTLVVTSSGLRKRRKADELKKRGVRFIYYPEKGRIDLSWLMEKLSGSFITSLLIEGGGELNASALEAGIVDKVLFLISPKIIGGREAKTPVEGEGISMLRKVLNITGYNVRRMGADLFIEGYL